MASDEGLSPVGAYLAAHVRRRRAAAVLRSAGWAVAASAGWALLACVADRLLALPAGVRIGAELIAAVGPLLIVARPAVRLFRRFDPVAAALSVERLRPVFAHRLVTVASAGPSSDLRQQLEREVADVVAATGPARVPRQPVAIAWAAALTALMFTALLWRSAWLDLPQLVRRLAMPTSAFAAVTTTRLTVQPGDVAVVEGQRVVIRAVTTRLVAPDGVTLHTSDDGGQNWVERPMPAVDDAFAAALNDIDGDVRYFVTAGDAVSRTYRLRVRRVPGVVAMRVRLDYPPDLHRPPRSADAVDGEIDAPIGTTVTVSLSATVPLRRAVLTVGPDRIETTATADPRVRRAVFIVRRDARVGVELTAVDGTPGNDPRSARVRVLK